MKTTFEKSRLAVAFVFFCPGLAYGLFTSRLPAIKLQSGIDEGEIGASGAWGLLLFLSDAFAKVLVAFPGARLGSNVASGHGTRTSARFEFIVAA